MATRIIVPQGADDGTVQVGSNGVAKLHAIKSTIWWLIPLQLLPTIGTNIEFKAVRRADTVDTTHRRLRCTHYNAHPVDCNCRSEKSSCFLIRCHNLRRTRIAAVTRIHNFICQEPSLAHVAHKASTVHIAQKYNIYTYYYYVGINHLRLHTPC